MHRRPPTPVPICPRLTACRGRCRSDCRAAGVRLPPTGSEVGMLVARLTAMKLMPLLERLVSTGSSPWVLPRARAHRQRERQKQRGSRIEEAYFASFYIDLRLAGAPRMRFSRLMTPPGRTVTYKMQRNRAMVEPVGVAVFGCG